ncbi:APC family permease [Amycolatopsis kentuckyensis]|uniref:APC family permease n=1 Tax=Amycolatopsis kentuckyensis TaxID=218823 RepID=UPI003566FB5C
MASSRTAVAPNEGTGQLKRAVGFYGLTFISLGSIIGSGWLLGALKAAQVAGPASIISWLLAAAMLAVLALIHAELGAAYPVAGGTARFPLFAYGTVTGFVAGWSAWLQAVAIAPIEVEASLEYLNNIAWVKDNLNLLHPDDGTLTASGFGWASLLMVVFTLINIVGVKLMSESNSYAVLWKTAVPLVTVFVLIPTSFHAANFTAGGGFAPYGAHGIFAALPVGVVFALQGFEQAIQLGGEARNPKRDLSRAVLTAMAVGALVYILLEIAFIGSIDPHNLIQGWANPIEKGDFGPYATLAFAAGAGWLAYVLYADAFVSPAGTGLVYVATSARLTYALGRDRLLPGILGKVNVRGIPLWSIILAFVVGEFSFLPFPSWQELVNVVTSATAVMYAFAPISLAALRKRDLGRPRPYRTPYAKVLAPIGFVSANLIIYWGGYDTTWKILAAVVVGLLIFAISYATTPAGKRRPLELKAAVWIIPWLVGSAIIGFLGRYAQNVAPRNILPEWWDLVTVVVFSLIIFYWAVNSALAPEKVQATVAAEEAELLTAEIDGTAPAV